MKELVFLKLGGSLITDKTSPYTPRPDKLADIAAQLSAAMRAQPDMSLVLGHGSGSFGHTAAKKYGTRDGVETADQWGGFAEVWFQASALNRFVMQALQQAGLPCLALAPVSAISASDGKISSWDLRPLKSALNAGLVPVIYGDVAFDQVRGGTILSTEDLFEHLARKLKPQRILLAGLEAAVWADFPKRTQRIEKITAATFNEIKAGVGASHGADVTGGMDSKVHQMLALVNEFPGMRAQIFSGEPAGNIQKALAGQPLGTIISARQSDESPRD
jgi:isopentenyl phosphate kinase